VLPSELDGPTLQLMALLFDDVRWWRGGGGLKMHTPCVWWTSHCVFASSYGALLEDWRS